MKLITFTHPLAAEQLKQVEDLTGNEIKEVRGGVLKVDNALPFEGQVRDAVNNLKLTSKEWQNTPLVVNLPGYGPAVAVVLAELHGRMGHFPTTVRVRPVANSTPQRYEIAEVMNLNSIREAAREKR